MTSEITNGTEGDEPASEEKAEELGTFSEVVRVVVYAVLIAVGVRIVAFEPFNIPSESMLPTLMVGDYLFVSKYPYGYSKHSLPFSPDLFSGRIFEDPVQRGDIAVFKRPLDNQTDYIKRIIGLPGDRIQVRSGLLYINGDAIQRERVADFVFEETPNSNCRDLPQYRFHDQEGTAFCRYPQFRETLPNGVSYMTLDLDPNWPWDNTGVYEVPAGHYFAMGDNRDNSSDSRKPITTGVGMVPAENLVGRAEIIFFSTDGNASWWQPWYWFQAMRGRRFFDRLRAAEADPED
ncbi:MAG: signal peptidase I [Sphingomonadales bacterium]